MVPLYANWSRDGVMLHDLASAFILPKICAPSENVEAVSLYDGLDRRIGIKESNKQIWTVYDGTTADALPYVDYTGGSGGGLSQRYLFGPGVVNGAVVDQILARTSAGGTTAWYLPDKLGSVRDIASSAGAVIDHIVYDSFGNILSESNATNGDRFKFAGMEYDAVTGLHYDRARYYTAAAGRFIGQDPIGFRAGSTNQYSYVSNGPTNATDPNGKWQKGGVPPQQDPGAKAQERQKLVGQAIATGNDAVGITQDIDSLEAALVSTRYWLGASALTSVVGMVIVAFTTEPYKAALAAGTGGGVIIVHTIGMITWMVGALSFAGLFAYLSYLHGMLEQAYRDLNRAERANEKKVAELAAFDQASVS
jgi:RHS repeat-associated protein